MFGGSHGSSRNMFINDIINKILEFDIIGVDRVVPNIVQEFKSEGWSFVLNFLLICLGPQMYMSGGLYVYMCFDIAINHDNLMVG